MMKRLPALILVLLLLHPPGLSAGPAHGPSEEGKSSWNGSPLFWGALTLLNGAILASSIGDLRFYESRAREVSDEGGDADPYWDASTREKVVIGVSAVSLLYSLAALKGSLDGPDYDLALQTAPRQTAEGEGNRPAVRVLSLEGRVRYDTLFAATAPEAEPDSVDLFGVRPPEEPLQQEGEVASSGDEDRIAQLLMELSADTMAPSAAAESSAEMAVEPAPEPEDSFMDADTPEAPPTFELLPYAVHVSSFRTLALAEEDEGTWKGRGERVVIEEGDVPGKGRWFRVYLGNFSTLEEARSYAASVQSVYGLEYAQAKKRAGY
jgi:hypothetical protein